jgi:hypothetical protein
VFFDAPETCAGQIFPGFFLVPHRPQTFATMARDTRSTESDMTTILTIFLNHNQRTAQISGSEKNVYQSFVIDGTKGLFSNHFFLPGSAW